MKSFRRSSSKKDAKPAPATPPPSSSASAPAGAATPAQAPVTPAQAPATPAQAPATPAQAPATPSAATPAAEAVAVAVPTGSMSIKQLKEKAQSLGIDFSNFKEKSEFVTAIESSKTQPLTPAKAAAASASTASPAPVSSAPANGTAAPQPVSSQTVAATPVRSAAYDEPTLHEDDLAEQSAITEEGDAQNESMVTTNEDVVGELPAEDKRPHLESRDIVEPTFEDDDMFLEKLDRFENLVEVGRGAQGIVYKCVDSSTGQIRALKEFKALDGPSKVTPDMENEIAIMLHLDHPNLTKLYEVFDAPGSDSLYLVMEFVDGGAIMDDKQLVLGKAQPIPPERAQVIFQQLISGLSYLHFRGVLHRDIKPSNILLDKSSGLIKLCDFGVSSFTNRRKSAKILGEDDIIYVGTCGTPAMLSPEALGAGLDMAFHGRPADVWAAGVTLFCMLYGRLPFTGKDTADMVKNIIDTPLAFPSVPMPSGAKEVITMMLRKDPAKRAVLAAVASHPWVNCGNWKDKLSSSQLDNGVSSPTNTRPIKTTNVLNRVKRQASSVVSKISASTRSQTAEAVPREPSQAQGPEDPVGKWFQETFMCCAPETRKSASL